VDVCGEFGVDYLFDCCGLFWCVYCDGVWVGCVIGCFCLCWYFFGV